MKQRPILVLGGTGKTGRRILQRLEALGHPTRLGSRSANPAFDWKERSTWRSALEGAGALYIAYHPDLAVPGAVEDVRALTELALELGVERIVLLSGRGEEEAQRAEAVLQSSGARWTILRASWFDQNFSENFMLDAIQSGTVALPVGDVREPFIDAEDIAEVAVAALTEEGHAGQLYELTGPRLLSFPEAVGLIASAAERPLDFLTITPEEYDQGLTELGLPTELQELIMYLFTTVLDGRNAKLGDGVQRALGREPRAFEAYASEVAATGIWSAQPCKS